MSWFRAVFANTGISCKNQSLFTIHSTYKKSYLYCWCSTFVLCIFYRSWFFYPSLYARIVGNLRSNPTQNEEIFLWGYSTNHCTTLQFYTQGFLKIFYAESMQVKKSGNVLQLLTSSGSDRTESTLLLKVILTVIPYCKLWLSKHPFECPRMRIEHDWTRETSSWSFNPSWMAFVVNWSLLLLHEVG